MMADSAVKMNAVKSVLKYEVSDRIRMDMRRLSLIYEAFFEESKHTALPVTARK
jgi:hypothetical protein